ncbi:hypothetical protein HCN51_52665 [Nonomuraea sp. FMUSA5-5]|uniref:Uncharacterized protein n=1 Tax=Nonomuraea composti TaxID=2720023 RepID=A0ABX1BNE4_9ACTN|nr:hypothetical protein [Nonomuraea sp. FMUSA5-5]NJP97987.1 hypothetical protein [Nonomuraea sp. FMUSA5-5]
MHIANEPNDPIDFYSYFILVSPALRAAAVRPLRRARHRGQACQGVQAARWCDECEQTICDLLLNGYNKLRAAMSGDCPRTKSGEPIKEMQAIVQWLSTPITVEELQHAASRLRQHPTPHEPPYIRAARAQLVHYELRSLEAKVTRSAAQARGASAQPARDLKTAAWAAPLRADDYAFELLLDAVLRLRQGACDPLAIPDHLINRPPHIGRSQAQRVLRASMETLRLAHPDFYCANVITFLYSTEELPDSVESTAPTPEDVIIDRENARLARRTLRALIGNGAAQRSQQHYRALLRDISATVLPSGPQLLAWVARRFDIDENLAELFLRRLVRLAFSAGLDWVADNCA